MTKKTDSSSNSTTYKYDNKNRVIRSSSKDINNSFKYDSSNNVIEATRNNKTTKYKYNSYSQITEVIDSFDNKTIYNYDKVGNLTKITYPDKATVNYSYNKFSELDTLKTNKESIKYYYDVKSKVVKEVSSNGTTTDYTYNDYNSLESKQIKVGSKTLSSFNYEYDKLKRISKEVSTIEGENKTKTYEYDNLNQLVKSTENNITTKYSYDSMGNKTKQEINDGKSTKITKYKYDQKTNELQNIDGKEIKAKLDYDNNGNITKKTYDSGLVESYSYDSNYNLTTVSNNIGVTTNYTYDAFDNRIAKNETVKKDDNDTFDLLNPSKKTYSDNLNNSSSIQKLENLSDNLKDRTKSYDYTCPQVVDDNNTISKANYEYVINYNQEYSKNLQVINSDDNSVIDTYYYNKDNLVINKNQYYKTTFYNTDGQNNVIGNISDNKTDIINNSYLKKVSYDDFGNPNKDLTNNYGYNSELHSSNDTQYLRYREYNTISSRFEERDSFLGYLDDSNSQNRYAYTQNDPINKIDPSGKWWSLNDIWNGVVNVAKDVVDKVVEIGKHVIDKVVKIVGNAINGVVNSINNFIENAKEKARQKKDEAQRKAIAAAKEKEKRNKEQIAKFMEDPVAKHYYNLAKAEFPNWSDEQLINFVKYCIAMGLNPFKQNFSTTGEFPNMYQNLNEQDKKKLDYYKRIFPATFISGYSKGYRGFFLIFYIISQQKNNASFVVYDARDGMSQSEIEFYKGLMIEFVETSFFEVLETVLKITSNPKMKVLRDYVVKGTSTFGIMNAIELMKKAGEFGSSKLSIQEFAKDIIAIIGNIVGSYIGEKLGRSLGSKLAVTLGTSATAAASVVTTPIGGIILGAIFAIGGAILGSYIGSTVGGFVGEHVVNMIMGEAKW